MDQKQTEKSVTKLHACNKCLHARLRFQSTAYFKLRVSWRSYDRQSSIAPQSQCTRRLRSWVCFAQFRSETRKAIVDPGENAIGRSIWYPPRVEEPFLYASWRLLPVRLPIPSLLLRPWHDCATVMVVAPAREVPPESLEQSFRYGEEIQIRRPWPIGLTPSIRRQRVAKTAAASHADFLGIQFQTHGKPSPDFVVQCRTSSESEGNPFGYP